MGFASEGRQFFLLLWQDKAFNLAIFEFEKGKNDTQSFHLAIWSGLLCRSILCVRAK